MNAPRPDDVLSAALVVSGGVAVGSAVTRGARAARSRAVAARAGTGPADGHRPPASSWRDRRATRRAAAAFERRLPAVVEAMARELRAGAPAPDAFARASSLIGGAAADAATAVRREVRSGTAFAGALEGWARRSPSGGVPLFAAVVGLGAELGGALAPALEATADALRDEQELADEVHSLTSQSRASARLLTGLPVVAATLLAALQPATLEFLLATPAGGTCTVMAVACDVVGWRWMRAQAGAVA